MAIRAQSAETRICKPPNRWFSSADSVPDAAVSAIVFYFDVILALSRMFDNTAQASDGGSPW